MLVSFTVGIIAAILLAAVGFTLVFLILKKLKVSPKGSVITGLIVGLVVGVIVIMSAGRIYVVHGIDDHKTMLVYGSPTYEFDNGYKLKLEMGSLEGYIINEMDEPLVLEEVIYTTSYYGGSEAVHVLCHPKSITEMPGVGIDYYFDNEPPMEITMSENQSEASKYWLRTYSDYFNEWYSDAYFDRSYKSYSAEPHNTASEPEEEGEDE